MSEQYRTKEQMEERRDKAAARSRMLSNSTREIGPLPAIANPERHAACSKSIRLFIETYCLPHNFLGWSDSHIRCLDLGQEAILNGGLFAFAMPRASGKTTLCERMALWALLYGYRKFVFCVGADAPAAQQTLEAIATEIETNDLLLEDFPGVCYPVRCLEGIHHRANGQTLGGERTRMDWTRDSVQFAHIEGHVTSGSVIRVAGITGRIRGAKVSAGDGISMRPDLVLVDDPQTDESARSVEQCATRERIINGAILGLSGPGKKIAGLIPCTVIRPGDLADTLLDRKRYPQFQGERVSMLTSMPSNDKLWAQYQEIRAEELRMERGIGKATEFYVANRAAMDEGAVHYWPPRFNQDEASAIQNAMNLKLQDEAAFWAEYQNKPIAGMADGGITLTAVEIQDKLSLVPKGIVPYSANVITGFIDVQADCLWWGVCAWRQDFTGWVIDYGVFPDQGASYVTMRDLRKTMKQKYGLTREGSIYAGMKELITTLQQREFRDSDGASHRLQTLMVDASWGESTDSVYQVCRETGCIPSHGRYVGVTNLPFQFYRHKPGDRFGLNWHMPSAGSRKLRYMLYDTNAWKSFVHARLATGIGDRGSLTLYGKIASTHRMIAQHLTSEVRAVVEAKNRKVDEWKLPSNKPDNHLLDVVVGCAVGASFNGCLLLEAARNEQAELMERARKRKRVQDLSI